MFCMIPYMYLLEHIASLSVLCSFIEIAILLKLAYKNELYLG